MSETGTLELTKKDFSSDQMVRWCPGCGDYAILSAMQTALPQLGRPREEYVFIAGIGCSSRFPYYMETYGFHTIHGRAPAIATGTKLANPDLSVWQITGDGDALSIGGNHFIHVLRRNVDINIILFNNEIYGLTKGQYSPTSPTGRVTKSSPQGSIETPFIPGELAIGARATFFARANDKNIKDLTKIFIEAEGHKGTSLIEVLQNCNIFNDKAFAHITDKENKEESQLMLEHGKPMIFGKEKNKGIILNGLRLEVAVIGENGVTEKDMLVHDAVEADPTLHLMLVRMRAPEFPMAFGVIRSVESPSYNDQIVAQIKESASTSKFKSVDDLFNSGDTWEIN